MKALFTLVLSAISFQLFAQDNSAISLEKDFKSKLTKAPDDTSKKVWRKGGVIGLNVSQSNLSNWAAGGDDYSLSINTAISGFAYYKKGKDSWDNTVNFNLGYMNTTSQGARKNDDKFDIQSKYGRALNKKLDMSMLFNIHSQFFKGYTFIDATNKTLNSDFMAPGYILYGLGLDYKPQKDLSIFFSPLTARWVIVNNDSLSAKGAYGVTPGSKSKFQLGAYGTVSYKVAINKNVGYTGRFDIFSDYLNHPENMAINMTNLFAVKISNALAVTYSLDFI